MGRELKLRIISALVLGAVVIELTWLGGQGFTLLWAVAAFLIMLETGRISSASIGIGPKLISLACLLLVLAAWIVGEFVVSLGIYAAGIVLICVWETVLRRRPWATVGLLYSGLPFFTITGLRGNADDSLLAVLVLFACVWGADIFAYAFGRTIGGPKLAPKISPNKTWSGFAGSLVGALVCSLAVILVAGYGPEPLLFLVVLALAVISQLGDLVESSFKRHFGVKDSGRIIPGHGGVLDRIDGLIFAGILFWLVLYGIKFVSGSEQSLPQLFLSRFLSA